MALIEEAHRVRDHAAWLALGEKIAGSSEPSLQDVAMRRHANLATKPGDERPLANPELRCERISRQRVADMSIDVLLRTQDDVIHGPWDMVRTGRALAVKSASSNS